MSDHIHTTPIELWLDGDFVDGTLELVADVRFRFVPAYAGRGPSYSDGGLPPEPADVEDIEVVKLRQCIRRQGVTAEFVEIEAPAWLNDWIIANVDSGSLIDIAEAEIVTARERAAEARAEDRRLEQ